MDRIAIIRTEEKKYHDLCYENYKLFEPGSWLHKPVKTVMDLMEEFNGQQNLNVLDLGCGIGRNSIPIAETLKNRNGKVVCVDLLVSAIEKLQENSERFEVQQYIETVQSDIEYFHIAEDEYDVIIAVSALEHVSSEEALERKLHEMALGTKPNGMNCIIINSNIREIERDSNVDLEPMFEVNLATDNMLELLDRQYEGWAIQTRLVKQLEYDIYRDEQLVNLITDCITFVVKKI
ncbi:2-polyprenyl-3-methyl-5-hydroxy-6-metoxy-1,4-benzoquinol methylase [Paenibacillus anaericanus]|uniref:class I SAM-dependent methyltransferase n=1 Tax=Paenibacillus anaericanus TaxID=170367 RepID=UPI00277D99D1|nr:class I SAM-dependent methyltransferase [Paenibacillus anaericanus]MDQ0088501.1 2-polyprenyl-3-methyl-5-hydroxy-6-metoxy-1,4-benzoquinol methylase [Paenibacillus anaericanus]